MRPLRSFPNTSQFVEQFHRNTHRHNFTVSYFRKIIVDKILGLWLYLVKEGMYRKGPTEGGSVGMLSWSEEYSPTSCTATRGNCRLGSIHRVRESGPLLNQVSVQPLLSLWRRLRPLLNSEYGAETHVVSLEGPKTFPYLSNYGPQFPHLPCRWVSSLTSHSLQVGVIPKKDVDGTPEFKKGRQNPVHHLKKDLLSNLK